MEQIGFELRNLFQKEGEFRTVSSLQSEPPVLYLFDTEGSEVYLELDEKTTTELLHQLKQLKRAYNGFRYYRPSKFGILDRLREIKTDWRHHKIYFLYFGLIAILFVIFFYLAKRGL